MCCGSDRLPSRDDLIEAPTPENEDRVVVVENLRDRLAQTEARLERARAREAELSCRLDEMKKFVRVMAILETYLRRRYTEQQDRITRLYSSPSSSLLVLDTCDYECPWRWNLLLRLFHYYIYEIDLILGSHFFFCDNFERLIVNMSTTNRIEACEVPIHPA